MPTPGQHTSGPANSYAVVHGPNYPDASAFSKAPPKCTCHKSKRAVSEWISGITRRLPLLTLPTGDRQRNATCSKPLVILFIVLLLCPMLYMFEDVRVRAVHLAQENAVLKGEMHELTKFKVFPFREIAKTMNTNMYVFRSSPLTLLMARLRDIWVGIDDQGRIPNFWSYGITTGVFNDNGPPVTSTKHRFTHSEAVIIESTEHRRIVGYKVESYGRDGGWWFATGLIEFGQSGSHDVKFSAKGLWDTVEAEDLAHWRRADFMVTVYYADWKLWEEGGCT